MERLIETLSFFLQLLIVGLVLAFLRHNYRWIYYPVKWFVTFLVSFMLTIIGFAAFKLIFGVSEVWFSQLMYDIGTSTNLFAGGVWFTTWLILIGSFVTSLIDNVISHIEQQIFCGEIYRFDEKSKLTTHTENLWNPSFTQSLFWNIYGLGMFIFIVFKLLTHEGTSLFNIWS